MTEFIDPSRDRSRRDTGTWGYAYCCRVNPCPLP